MGGRGGGGTKKGEGRGTEGGRREGRKGGGKDTCTVQQQVQHCV